MDDEALSYVILRGRVHDTTCAVNTITQLINSDYFLLASVDTEWIFGLEWRVICR